MLATLDDVEFIIDDSPGPITIRDNGLRGWFFGGTTTESPRARRMNGIGEFVSPGRESGRLITVEGRIASDSAWKHMQRVEQIAGLLPDGELGTFTVNEPQGARWARVQRHGEPHIEHLVWGERSEFRFALLAPNPRIYGITHTTPPGMTAEVRHEGNTRAYPILTVTGSLAAGYRVVADGKAFPVTAGPTGSTVHEIDVLNMRLRVNGTSRPDLLGAVEQWSVPKSTTVLHTLIPVSGSGAMTVAITDTYKR